MKAMRVSKKDYELVKKTNLFNKEWYLSQYSDVSLSGMDPILHYLKYGGALKRRPSRAFDINFYEKQVGQSALQKENPLLHYLKIGIEEEYRINVDAPTKFEKDIKLRIVSHLWGGHSKIAQGELEGILKSSVFLLRERVFSGWHLARWHHFNGNYESALEIAKYVEDIDPGRASQKRFVMLFTFCYISLGLSEEARSRLRAYLEKKPEDSDAILAISNIDCSSDQDKLDYINSIYQLHSFAEIRKVNDMRPLSLHNITASIDNLKVRSGELVSVIMPIYNAQDNIDTAIRGLVEQTWQNIEIIAVDDVSTDETYTKILEWARKDSRVIPVRLQVNGGAYQARNAGLRFAKGKYITTHDSDDWSHPQKIEAQVKYLKANIKRKGVLTHWVRCRDNLTFTQNWRLNSELIHWSHSSFLFSSEILEKIGKWDGVMIGGDTEFIWRIEKVFGPWSIKKIHKPIPFSFALDEETSLTRTKSTHVKTIHHGLRHMYREACMWWHRLHNKNDIFLNDQTKSGRSFPTSKKMVSRSDEISICDELIAGDFSREVDCAKLKNYLAGKTASLNGAIAVFHWPSYFEKVSHIKNSFFEDVCTYDLQIVVTGEVLHAKKYTLLNSTLLECTLDSYPEFVDFQKWSIE
ncbi:glycosyltransferase [Salinicola halophyticus]|uniref:glycosyltransferase n=1 Tax=Salinicola halophyticus TaxID=1808881 RepID=UPI003F45EE35